MEEIEALSSTCRVASAHDTVLHSECALTFHSPYTTKEGILVNMKTFMGTVPQLAFHGSTETKALFLRIVKERIEKQISQEEAKEQQPTKLAIGVEGGFATEDDKYETMTKYSLVVVEAPQKIISEVEYNADDASIPEPVKKSAESIIHHAGMAVQQDLAVWQGDEEEIPVSKYANDDLEFVDNGVTISPDPKTWKCQKRGDTENLWLNLSDGYIGGGRQHWDGSGGSNGALDHFKETGEKYPLVVKLGTITAEGGNVSADCYSYAKDEDGPVKIPNLKELLAKRGIQVAGLQKTEKSTAELEVELNMNYAFDAITESGSQLVSVSGPNLQGLQNLGNSCYMNSVVQLLCSLQEISIRYGTSPDADICKHKFFDGVTPTAAINDVLIQMTKLASALTSGVFSIPKESLEDTAVTTNPKFRLAPRMFKHVVGKDHVDFKTGQQQDAVQFLQHLLEHLDRAEAKKDKSMISTSNLFSFKVVERLVCSADQKIKYKESAPETILSLRIPMDKAEPAATSGDVEPEQKKPKHEGEESEEPIPTVKFDSCLESWGNDITVDDIRWPHLQNAVHPATQTTKFKNFPRYILVQMQRYQLGPDWQPVKLEVNLDIPEEIDLSEYKSAGQQEGENLVPEVEEETNTVVQKPTIDEAALGNLMDMGFSLNGCKRALTAVGGSDTEAAMNWIFEHNADPDFNDPLPEAGDEPTAPSGGGGGGGGDGVDDAVVMSLVESLGCFTIDQVRAALKETSGAADRAADWLFSHMDDLDGAIAALNERNQQSAAVPKVELEDGEGKYTMMGMISHIGKHTGSGHYVAHLKRDGKWVIFNDEKVALSANPPIPHAYLYLFQRNDTIGSPKPDY